MENHLEKEKVEKAMEVEISERYVNPYTDFGSKSIGLSLEEIENL